MLPVIIIIGSCFLILLVANSIKSKPKATTPKRQLSEEELQWQKYQKQCRRETYGFILSGCIFCGIFVTCVMLHENANVYATKAECEEIMVIESPDLKFSRWQELKDKYTKEGKLLSYFSSLHCKNPISFSH